MISGEEILTLRKKTEKEKEEKVRIKFVVSLRFLLLQMTLDSFSVSKREPKASISI